MAYFSDSRLNQVSLSKEDISFNLLKREDIILPDRVNATLAFNMVGVVILISLVVSVGYAFVTLIK